MSGFPFAGFGQEPAEEVEDDGIYGGLTADKLAVTLSAIVYGDDRSGWPFADQIDFSQDFQNPGGDDLEDEVFDPVNNTLLFGNNEESGDLFGYELAESFINLDGVDEVAAHNDNRELQDLAPLAAMGTAAMIMIEPIPPLQKDHTDPTQNPLQYPNDTVSETHRDPNGLLFSPIFRPKTTTTALSQTLGWHPLVQSQVISPDSLQNVGSSKPNGTTGNVGKKAPRVSQLDVISEYILLEGAVKSLRDASNRAANNLASYRRQKKSTEETIVERGFIEEALEAKNTYESHAAEFSEWCKANASVLHSWLKPRAERREEEETNNATRDSDKLVATEVADKNPHQSDERSREDLAANVTSTAFIQHPTDARAQARRVPSAPASSMAAHPATSPDQTAAVQSLHLHDVPVQSAAPVSRSAKATASSKPPVQTKQGRRRGQKVHDPPFPTGGRFVGPSPQTDDAQDTAQSTAVAATRRVEPEKSNFLELYQSLPEKDAQEAPVTGFGQIRPTVAGPEVAGPLPIDQSVADLHIEHPPTAGPTLDVAQNMPETDPQNVSKKAPARKARNKRKSADGSTETPAKKRVKRESKANAAPPKPTPTPRPTGEDPFLNNPNVATPSCNTALPQSMSGNSGFADTPHSYSSVSPPPVHNNQDLIHPAVEQGLDAAVNAIVEESSSQGTVFQQPLEEGFLSVQEFQAGGILQARVHDAFRATAAQNPADERKAFNFAARMLLMCALNEARESGAVFGRPLMIRNLSANDVEEARVDVVQKLKRIASRFQGGNNRYNDRFQQNRVVTAPSPHDFGVQTQTGISPHGIGGYHNETQTPAHAPVPHGSTMSFGNHTNDLAQQQSQPSNGYIGVNDMILGNMGGPAPHNNSMMPIMTASVPHQFITPQATRTPTQSQFPAVVQDETDSPSEEGALSQPARDLPSLNDLSKPKQPRKRGKSNSNSSDATKGVESPAVRATYDFATQGYSMTINFNGVPVTQTVPVPSPYQKAEVGTFKDIISGLGLPIPSTFIYEFNETSEENLKRLGKYREEMAEKAAAG